MSSESHETVTACAECHLHVASSQVSNLTLRCFMLCSLRKEKVEDADAKSDKKQNDAKSDKKQKKSEKKKKKKKMKKKDKEEL